jgi:hypothetical protein
VDCVRAVMGNWGVMLGVLRKKKRARARKVPVSKRRDQ